MSVLQHFSPMTDVICTLSRPFPPVLGVVRMRLVSVFDTRSCLLVLILLPYRSIASALGCMWFVCVIFQMFVKPIFFFTVQLISDYNSVTRLKFEFAELLLHFETALGHVLDAAHHCKVRILALHIISCILRGLAWICINLCSIVIDYVSALWVRYQCIVYWNAVGFSNLHQIFSICFACTFDFFLHPFISASFSCKEFEKQCTSCSCTGELPFGVLVAVWGKSCSTALPPWFAWFVDPNTNKSSVIFAHAATFTASIHLRWRFFTDK